MVKTAKQYLFGTGHKELTFSPFSLFSHEIGQKGENGKTGKKIALLEQVTKS